MTGWALIILGVLVHVVRDPGNFTVGGAIGAGLIIWGCVINARKQKRNDNAN